MRKKKFSSAVTWTFGSESYHCILIILFSPEENIVEFLTSLNEKLEDVFHPKTGASPIQRP